jgi:hypothetical protein
MPFYASCRGLIRVDLLEDISEFPIAAMVSNLDG